MSGKQKKRPEPPAEPAQAAPPPPASATRAGVVGAAVLVIAVLGWAMARVSDAAPRGTQIAVGGPAPVEAQPGPGFTADVWFLPDDSLLGFVEIPEGLFLMGSEPSDSLAFTNEHWADGTGPASVHESTFYIARYEVTRAQYRAFASSMGYVDADALPNGSPDHPVTSVAWTDALAYARWLEAGLKANPATPPVIARLLAEGWHVTLPTEGQWEKAARGTDGRRYPWGVEPRTDRGNFQGTETERVGSHDCPECPYGLSDMSGNVWELTRTPFRDGPHDPRVAGPDLAADALWVMRGGSFEDPARNVRAAVRGGVDPGARRDNIGFRLVLSR